MVMRSPPGASRAKFRFSGLPGVKYGPSVCAGVRSSASAQVGVSRSCSETLAWASLGRTIGAATKPERKSRRVDIGVSPKVMKSNSCWHLRRKWGEYPARCDLRIATWPQPLSVRLPAWRSKYDLFAPQAGRAAPSARRESEVRRPELLAQAAHEIAELSALRVPV